jgi:putative membrane protein
VRKAETDELAVGKGLLAGLLAGLAASWAMNQFQTGWSKWSACLKVSQPTLTAQPSRKQSQEEQLPATVKAASAVSKRLFNHQLTDQEKPLAGSAVHYGFGAAMGALYGVLAEMAPWATSAAGIPFGAGLWLVADETAVPAFGLGEPLMKTPASLHVYSLVSHLVYGLTTELTRRAMRRLWKAT